MYDNKLNVLFDVTILVDGEFGLCKRTGFFFVALYLLDSFFKRNDVHVVLVAKPAKMAGVNKVVEKYFHQEIDVLYKSGILSKLSLHISLVLSKLRNRYFKISCIRKIFSGLSLMVDFVCEALLLFMNPVKLKENIIYFSPQTNAPLYIERKKLLKKFAILHDCIPLKLLGYKSQINPKLPSYFSNPDYYFFSNSQSTLNDFLDYYDVNKSHVFLAYLAAGKKFYPQKNENLLTLMRCKYHLPKGKKYVFSLCTLEPRKNLIRALSSFVLFVEKNHITDLVFVLGGSAWESFENLLKKNKMILGNYQKYIVRAGYVEDEDLSILYSNAEWFVYTSQYEGFGLPPLEAMQCGCPVITSNNSSLPEVVGDVGIMIDWNSDEQHIEAYEKYYFNDELRKENSRRGLERARLFSWDKTADEMLSKMQMLKNGVG